MRFVVMIMSLCFFIFISSISWAIKYHIPHVTGESTQWATNLQVDNHYSAASSFTVNLFRSGVLSVSKAYTVQAGSYMNVNLKALDPYAQTGYIECSSACINFRILYEYLSGAGKAEFLLSPDTYATLAFLFPNQTSGMTWKGMAFYNPWSEAASVTIYALGGGKVLGQKTDTVFPNEKHVGTIQTWFPGR